MKSKNEIRIEAIKVLEKDFKNDAKYRKDWTDYIEIIVTQECESIKISLKDLKKIRTAIAKEIIGTLFDSHWWESQS